MVKRVVLNETDTLEAPFRKFISSTFTNRLCQIDYALCETHIFSRLDKKRPKVTFRASVPMVKRVVLRETDTLEAPFLQHLQIDCVQ